LAASVVVAVNALDAKAVPLHDVRELRPRGALRDVGIDEKQRLQLC